MSTMGDDVAWQSVKWPDGSRYEGLVKDELCHVRGVFNYNGGDKYMGEYLDNQMDGKGVYVWNNGTVYRGEWKNSMMHGCGVKITKQPNGRFIAEEGEFVNDEWAGDVMACSVKDARKAAAQADTAAQMAMVFELHHPKKTGAEKPKDAEKLLSNVQKKVAAQPNPLQFVQELWDKVCGGSK